MIPELGNYALTLALCLALIQATLPLYGAARGRDNYMQLARYTGVGQFIFVGFSFFALAYCFLTNNFSVAYVAENSNTHLPLIYKFCAVWGAHEGSLLLWVFVLSIWTAAVSVFSRSLPLPVVARVLAVMGMIAIGFYCFILLTSNPFTRILPNFPINGRDLNPILQDPGLAIHPPMLYMGYVGFSVAFAFAIAALIGGRLDAAWARWSRPWTQVAWCFLTFGIVLGSWWAYRELGWGGWWFWDPVENASFLPWLVGTALIHSLMVVEKRDVFKAWAVLLAVCAFSLSLLGTFLVRSGILISVHAFAVDPKRGMYLLRFLMVVVGLSMALYAWRAKTIVNSGYFNFWSRETALLANNVILFVAMITVLTGTLYPLIMAVLHLDKLSVGAPYFNEVFTPLMIPLLLLMGIGPRFLWQDTPMKKLVWSFVGIAVLVIICALAIPFVFQIEWRLSVVVGLLLAFWVIANTVAYIINKKSRAKWSMILAHMGLAVTVIGVMMASTYSVQRNLSMQPGDTAHIGAYGFVFKGMQPLTGPDYTGYQATFVVSKNGHQIAVLHPQLRNFPVQQTTVAKSAINMTVTRDLYIGLGNSLGNGAWSVRIYYKPFVRWIWGGGLLMVLGGIIALFRKCNMREEFRASEARA